jgi:hypothetical protein
LQGLQRLARHAATAAGEAFDLGESGIALLRPLGGRGGVLAGGGDLGEDAVDLPDVVQAQRFVDLAGGVGVVLGGGKVAEAEVEDGELEEGRGFAGLVAERFPDPQRFLDEGESGSKLRRAAPSSPRARAESPSC